MAKTYRIPEFHDGTWIPGGPLGESWRYDYLVGRDVTGAIVLRELRIRRTAKSHAEYASPLPKGGITRAVLNRIRFREETRYASQVLAQQRLDPEPSKKPAKWLEGKKPGPKPLSIALYKRVGARFRALALERSPHPAKTLAREFGYSRVGMRALLYRYDRMANRGLVPSRIPPRKEPKASVDPRRGRPNR